jgi:hypothetical protein
LDKQTLHEILESASLAIESEDDLLRTLISLGSEYFEFWSYIEIVFLTDEGLSLFVDKLSFLSICRFLGNERLAPILLASMNSSLESDSRSPSTTSFRSSDEGSNDLVFCDANVDSCASQFHSYSVDELLCLDKQTLHEILESASLAIESDDR